MRPLFFLSLLLMNFQIIAQNQYPEISNLSAQFDNTSQVLTVSYDLFDAEGESMLVSFLVSDDNGESYLLDTQNATGDLGSAIQSGTGKTISWDVSTAVPGAGDYKIKLVADDLFQIDIQSIVDQVDSNQLLSNLQFMEGIRHRTVGPDLLEATKDSIEQRFITAGLQTTRQDFPFGTFTGQNIIGRREGMTQSDTTYIVDAHFDTVNDSPGADDNGSGVAGVMEALRVLAPYRFAKTLRFIGFDLEEEGLLGSFDFVDNNIGDSETIKGVFNMEMIGYYTEEPNSQEFPTGFEILYPDVQADLVADQFRGNFITNIGDQNSLALMAAYNSAAAQYVPDLKTVSIAAPANWPGITPDLGRSDHAPFWLQDIPALMLTDGSNFRNPFYHSPNDLLTTLDFTFMTNVVKAVVGAVAEEAGIQHSTMATADFSVAVGLKNTLDCAVQLSPVPAKDFLSLKFGTCNMQSLDLQVVDILGNTLLSKSITANDINQFQLDLRNWEAGIYFLNLSDGKRELSRKFIVE
ncbi:MAG: hypothetical protein ACJATF_002415 [Flavobacteriales bacterium]|jgi:hypothetical protein